MRNNLLLIGLGACLLAGPATANQGNASKNETVGAGAGATVGALLGGPVGFIVGAAIGAKIGDEFKQRNDEVDNLGGSLKGSQQRVASLEQSIDALNGDITELGGELQRMQTITRPGLLNLMRTGVAMDLLFRTDEHVLVDTTGTRLMRLAASLATMPDVLVQLDGFADERGDAAYNQQLSARRVEHVRQLLVSHGVSVAQIRTEAHGESPAADAHVDSYALERKVSLTFFIEDAPSFAAQLHD